MNARHREGRAAEAREERSASKTMLGDVLGPLCQAHGSTADARNQAVGEVRGLLRLARKGKLSTAPLDPACAKGVGEAHKLSKRTCHIFALHPKPEYRRTTPPCPTRSPSSRARTRRR